jgi:hypothetical protein
MAVYCQDGIPVQFVWPALGQPSRGVSPLKLAKKIKRTYVSIQLQGLRLPTSQNMLQIQVVLELLHILLMMVVQTFGKTHHLNDERKLHCHLRHKCKQSGETRPAAGAPV